jgi:hypothetical protein
MGQWSGIRPRVRGKLCLESQFQTVVCRKGSRSYLTSFKLRRLATCETTVGVVYGHGEIGLHSNSVSTLGSAREGRWTLMIVRSGKYEQGLNPF